MWNIFAILHQLWPLFLTFAMSISVWVILSQQRSNLQKLREGYRKELDLPNDIIIEILSRLPVKSLLRFKCVNKLWYTIIKDQKFMEKHRRRGKSNYVYVENTEFKPITVGSGLVLEKSNLTNKYRLRNPSTRQILDLPDVFEKSADMNLVYLPSIGKCKLVYSFFREGTTNGGCKILTVGIDHTWRTIDIPRLYNLRTLGNENIHRQAINSVYYIAMFFTSVPFYGSHDIVFLDLESESFGNIKIPWDFFTDWKKVGLLRWERKLSLWSRVDEELHVWVLENYKKQKWADRKIVISLSFLRKHPYVDSVNCNPWFVRNGILSFLPYNKYHLLYDIESQKDRCVSAPSGKQFSYYDSPSLMSL